MNGIHLVRPNIGQPLMFDTWPESFRITVAGRYFDQRPTRDTLTDILPPLVLSHAERSVRLPLTVVDVLEPLLYPLPDGTPDPSLPYFFQHYAGFQWEFTIIVRADWPDNLQPPAMWNLEMGEETNYHALYIAQSPASHTRFLHITDTHIAGRNDAMRAFFCDTVYEEWWQKREFCARNVNPNDNLRDVIKYANERADAGELDFVVLTGDIVDYIYDGYCNLDCDSVWMAILELLMANPRKFLDAYGDYDWGDFLEKVVAKEYHFGYDPRSWIYSDPAHCSNFDTFVKIVAGVDGEGLKVPIYTVPGNHDYLAYEPLLAFDLHVPTPDKIELMFKKLGVLSFALTIWPINYMILDYALSQDVPPEYQEQVDRFSRPRLSFFEALMFDRWKQGLPYEPSDLKQPSVSVGKALRFWMKPRLFMFAREYLTKISYDTDYVFQVPGKGHQFVCLNTGWDVGIPTKEKLYDYALGDADLERNERLALEDHVRNSGFRPIHEELLAKALDAAGADHAVVLCHHAPMLSDVFYSDQDEPHELWSRPSGSVSDLAYLPEAAPCDGDFCDYDTAVRLTRLLGLEGGPCSISLAGHTHRATEHRLAVTRVPEGVITQMFFDRYSARINSSGGIQLSTENPLLFQSGSLVSRRRTVREMELKGSNELSKAQLHLDVPGLAQKLPAGSMAPFLSAAAARFSRLGYQGQLSNLGKVTHETLSEEAAGWDTDRILAETASHFHNIIHVVDFGDRWAWNIPYHSIVWPDSNYKILVDNNYEEFIIWLHDLWKRLEIEGTVGWYDIYLGVGTVWVSAWGKNLSMAEQVLGVHWLQQICSHYHITYPPPDLEAEWHLMAWFLWGGLVCTGMALWLNRFGATGDSRIYPIDLEKNELEEEYSQLLRDGALADDYQGYIAERLVRIFAFAEQKRKHPVCLWYAFESTYLAEEGDYSNPEWNNLDPAYHLELARSLSKAEMVRRLVGKYRQQCQRQLDAQGVEGLKAFYARNGARLNAWVGHGSVEEFTLASEFPGPQAAEDALVENVKAIAEKLMPYPPAPDPDSYEPNDDFEQAAPVDLTAYPEPTLRLDQLTFHQPEDRDLFLITYPEIDEVSPFDSLDCEWFVVTAADAGLSIRAWEAEEYYDFETSFTFALYDYAQRTQKHIAESTHDSGVSKPTELFPERRLYLEVKNPDNIPLSYTLEIAFKEPSMGVQAKKPLVEAEWFESPWDSTVFENPAEVVEAFVRYTVDESVNLSLIQEKNVAAFQNELGRLAESFSLLDKAEELYVASSTRYEGIDDFDGAIGVLHGLESLYTRLNDMAKAIKVRNHIRSLTS